MDFLVIDDEKSIREAASMLIDDEGHYAESCNDGASALARLKEEKFDAILLDLNLGSEKGLDLLPQVFKLNPHAAVVIFTAQGSVQNAVEAMRLGAVDFIEKPFTRDQFRTVLARLARFRQMGQRIETLEKEVTSIRRESGPKSRFDFETPVMKEVMDVLFKAARAPASILILGESGTGKSVVARAVHEASHLKDKPFVTVSCPSLSKELLQSELFGHVKGAFTGAIKDYWGKVKQAEGGTLFLDEIGELPMEIQPKLLRLLQEREYERVGESTVREANVRVIAATNCDLKKCVAGGTFREDLYFRLNVITVEMPPLRSRPEDLLRFAEYYAGHFAAQLGRKMDGISEAAKSCMQEYGWPGNLRELRNAIERAVILTSNRQIQAEDLPMDVRNGVSADPDRAAAFGENSASSGLMSLEQLEESHIRRVVEHTPNLSDAARLLGIDQATLYRKRKKMGLK